MDNIIKKAYEKILNDEWFVKLTVFSLLPYSLLFVWYLFYQTYFFINSVKHWVHLENLKLYIDKVFQHWNDFFWPFLIIIIIWLIWYFFLPPIAEWALISHLDKWKSISTNLWRGFVKFFAMLELHWFLSIFSFLFFFIAISRLYVVDMLNNFIVITFIFIWLFFIIFFNFSSIYAKYLVILENKEPFDAIKGSIKLAFLNFKITWKYFFIYMLLYVRIIFNIIILIWIPLLFLYLFLKTNVFHITFVKYLIFIIMWLMFIITAYVNWIIEAFFIAMWYDIYKNIEKE